MSKKIYQYINNNFLNYKLYIYFLLLISKMYLICSEDITGINAPYPICLQLSNNNLFIANKVGMHICDKNLENSRYHPYYNKTINIFENIINKILIVQFDDNDDKNIICVIDDVFYFFKENDDFILMGYLPVEITQSTYYNLLAYKKNLSYYHFIISFIDDQYKYIYIYHYKINEHEYSIVSNYTYSPFYFDYPMIKINNKLFTCQIINSDTKGNVLTCCFQTYLNNLIVINSFDIEKNLTEIEEYYSKIPIDNINMIDSTISIDKKNIIVCYSLNNFYGYYFIYNFDKNEILINNPVVEKCISKYTTFKVSYFKEKEEYIFICDNDNNGKFTIIRIDKNFNLINLDEITASNFNITGIYFYNSLSLMYDKNENKYAIILDHKNSTLDSLITKKYFINTDFTRSFASQKQKPEQINEISNNYTLIIDDSNKYYISIEDHIIFVTSNETKLIIDFVDENNLFIKTRENKPINKYLYSFNIDVTDLKGKLTIDINGEEKQLEKISRISNITQLNYYPDFRNGSFIVSISYVLYLTNKTVASLPGLLMIYGCNPNCTCNQNNTFCINCLDNYVHYQYKFNCIKLDDLKSVFKNQDDIYYDCYEKCKTCTQRGYSTDQMLCSSCFIEYGDYLEYGNCKEKKCDNLYYIDKDTNMKTCINETICPEEYPFLNNETYQCTLEKDKDLTTVNPSDSFLISQWSDFSENEIYMNEQIINITDKFIGIENIDQINKTYSILSNLIQKGSISSFKEDFMIVGVNITYQITTSEKQKKSNHNSNISIIELGECEKIIKRNISYIDDPTALIILKIDIKKEGIKTTAVEYEVNNPYTREKIDLSICSNITIAIYAPVNLNDDETSLYNNLNEQGYDLFDVNNSFYLDPCSPYTSTNGTDVSLSDRKDYYYNEDIVLCEDTCQYIEVNTKSNQVYCECSIKNSVNVGNDQQFSSKKLLENFYKVDTYTNFEVLFCYKLLFSSKGLTNNICFYILLVLFVIFLTSMIINLFNALKKIDKIIFKIFQDKYMYYLMQKIIMEGRKRKLKNKNKGNCKSKLSWLEKLKMAKNKKNENKSPHDEGDSDYQINKKKIINDLINISDSKDNPQNHNDNLYLNENSTKRKTKFRNSAKIKGNKIINENKINNNEIISNEDDNKSINNIKNNVKLNLNKLFFKNNNNIDNNNKNVEKFEKQKKDCLPTKKIGNININIINNIMNNQNPPIKKKTDIENENNFKEKSYRKKRKKKRRKN